MSRLTDALRVLLGKCTPAGTQPVGDKLDDLVECLAGYFDGDFFRVTFSWVDGNFVSDKSASEIYDAFNAGKYISATTINGRAWQLRECTKAGVSFVSVSSVASSSFVCEVAVLTGASKAVSVSSIQLT